MRKHFLPILAVAAVIGLVAPNFVNQPTLAQTVPAAQSQGTIVEIKSTAQFDDLVSKSTTPIIVDFHATWCGPCHRFAPLFKQAASDFAGKVTFVKVDIDENPDLTTRYNIQFVPTLKLFSPGNTKMPSADTGGFRNLKGFKDWLVTNAKVTP